MHKFVTHFESDLRQVVRRGSKSPEFENPIQEITGHYSDLFEESIAQGASEQDADRSARERIGSLGQIALQILNNASRQTRGLRIQKALFWVPMAAVLYFIGSQSMLAYGLFHWTLAGFVPLTWLAIASGLVYGYGIVLARRLLWKPVTIACLLTACLLFPFYNQQRLAVAKDKAEREKNVKLYLKLQPALGRDQTAVSLYLKDQKPFAERNAVAAPIIEHSTTSKFRIDPQAQGAYLIPTGIVYNQAGLLSSYMSLSRTNDSKEAQKAWLTIGRSFYGVQDHISAGIAESQWVAEVRPWPLWYVIFGAIMVPITFQSVFFGLAVIGGIGSRVWILRGEWLRYAGVKA